MERGYLIGAAPPSRLKDNCSQKEPKKPKSKIEISEFDSVLAFSFRSSHFSFMKGAPSGAQGRTYRYKFSLKSNNLSMKKTVYFSDKFKRQTKEFPKDIIRKRSAISEEQSNNLIELIQEIIDNHKIQEKTSNPPESKSYSIQISKFPKNSFICKKKINFSNASYDITSNFEDKLLQIINNN